MTDIAESDTEFAQDFSCSISCSATFNTHKAPAVALSAGGLTSEGGSKVSYGCAYVCLLYMTQTKYKSTDF